MKYVGSKLRHAKEMVPIITRGRKSGQCYVEPFVGGCGMMANVQGGPKIGNDTHGHLIAMWKAVQGGWVPPSKVSESLYQECKSMKEGAPDPLVGFVGFACSFGGKWFGGYARGKAANGSDRNYADEGSRGTMKKAINLNDVDFLNVSYDQFPVPPNSIIYCDPPYSKTTRYASGEFDSRKFWTWCEKMVNEGHRVFVSEYVAPDPWISIYEKKVNSSLDRNTGGKQGVEKLFSHPSNGYNE